jgi:hypothetical protein
VNRVRRESIAVKLTKQWIVRGIRTKVWRTVHLCADPEYWFCHVGDYIKKREKGRLWGSKMMLESSCPLGLIKWKHWQKNAMGWKMVNSYHCFNRTKILQWHNSKAIRSWSYCFHIDCKGFRTQYICLLCKVHWLRLFLLKGHNTIGISPPLTSGQKDPISEMLFFHVLFEYRVMGKFQKWVTLPFSY